MYIIHFKEDNSGRTILKIVYHSEYFVWLKYIYLFVVLIVFKHVLDALLFILLGQP